MINIVTIDPSLTSTALTINGRMFSLASEHIALTKKLEYNKWFSLASDHCDIHLIDSSYKDESSYALLETYKLETFQRTANLIRKLVDIHCHVHYNTLVLIEGYSYSSVAGPLIDLVTLGTLIRRNFFSRYETELVVMSPSSVKKMAAKLTYPAIDIGKKVTKLEYRNNEGIAGGNFKKHDMYNVLTENDSIQTDWVNFLRDQKSVIFDSKKIPKPIEDLNDSAVMYHIALKIFQDNEDFLRTVKILRQ
jgi:hypothetical protein